METRERAACWAILMLGAFQGGRLAVALMLDGPEALAVLSSAGYDDRTVTTAALICGAFALGVFWLAHNAGHALTLWSPDDLPNGDGRPRPRRRARLGWLFPLVALAGVVGVWTLWSDGWGMWSFVLVGSLAAAWGGFKAARDAEQSGPERSTPANSSDVPALETPPEPTAPA